MCVEVTGSIVGVGCVRCVGGIGGYWGSRKCNVGGGVGSVLCRIEGLMTDNVGVTGVVWYLQAVCRV